MQINDPVPQYVAVGGDFARVFDHADYISMVNSLDEASVILRAHLILEEFLNIWCSRLTATEDLFAGIFFQFKTKLVVSRNLGLPMEYEEILNRFNDIRNAYSHRRKYALELNRLDSLRVLVNALPSEPPLLPCEQFSLFLEGTDQHGQRRQVEHKWETSDTKKRVVFVFVILVMKFVKWMQGEFNRRGVKYDLILTPVPAGVVPVGV